MIKYGKDYIIYDNRYMSCLNDIICYHELTVRAYDRIHEMINEIMMKIDEVKYTWGIK